MSLDMLEPSDEELSWDRVRFGREERRAIVLGLEKHQLIALGVVLAVVVAFVVVFGFPVGWLVGGTVLIGGATTTCSRWHGSSIMQWAARWMGMKTARTRGHGRYLYPVRSQTPLDSVAGDEPVSGDDTGPAPRTDAAPDDGGIPAYRSRVNKKGKTVLGSPERFMLPGELNELLCYEMLSGEAFVYDPVNGYGIIAAQVESDSAFALDSDDEQVNRTESFSDVLTALSSQAGIEFVQLTDQTSVISGKRILDFYRDKGAKAPVADVDGTGPVPMSGNNINPFASKGYENLVSGAKGIVQHEGWVVVVLNRKKLAATIKSQGGGVAGFMGVAAGTISDITDLLAPTGTVVKHWMSGRQMASCIRRSTDPAAAVEVSERSGSFAGVAPSSAGPMVMVPEWNRLITDTGHHRSWWVSEWPRKRAKLGFLSKLIFAGDFRHTVTLIARPYPAKAAMREVTASMSDYDSGIKIQEKTGRPVSRAQKLEGTDLTLREVQLNDGFGAMKLGGYVSVSAFTEDEMERQSTKLSNAAAAAQLELRCLYGQQAEGFVASAMPLGRGLL
ncbi:SCO6880 family protein [Arthrobacter pigmenti]